MSETKSTIATNGEPQAKYATPMAIPARLYNVAKDNAPLISQVTIDAYQFIYSRCNKDVQVGVIVSLSLATLFQEYEKGIFTKIEDFDQDEYARKNDEALNGLTTKMHNRCTELTEGLGGIAGRARTQRIAERIYNEQRALNPTNADGVPYPDFWSKEILDKTRAPYFFAAAVALSVLNEKRSPCLSCGASDAPMYDVEGGLVCGDCIDRAVDARKEAECEPD